MEICVFVLVARSARADASAPRTNPPRNPPKRRPTIAHFPLHLQNKTKIQGQIFSSYIYYLTARGSSVLLDWLSLLYECISLTGDILPTLPLSCFSRGSRKLHEDREKIRAALAIS